MNRLARALSGLSNQGELTDRLAQVLAHAAKKGRLSYREIEEMVNGAAEDVLLFGNEWGLIFPVRTLKSAAWEDRLLVAKPEELYEVPNIIRYLVGDARKTGCWESGSVITRLFKEMGEPAWEKMPKLVEKLGKQSKDYRITAIQLKEICNDLGLGDRVDMLIAELKASGVMSPKLSSLAEVSRAASPIYKLAPSLFIRKGERIIGQV